jgi:anti-sigma regulatory factor (Ser/Thr protein kinase)
MTSEGSEEIAATALLRGAVSYVPKRMLAHILIDTLRGVLGVTGEKRNLSRVLTSICQITTEFELENDPDLLAPLISYLQDAIMTIGVCDDTEQMRVGIALNEALVNALYHGNLEVDSSLREQESGEFYTVAKDRTHKQPYAGRKLFLSARITPEEASFTVRDQGPGFDPTSLPDPTDPANLERISGRGILLMRTFMNDVTFNDSGNEVTMVKKCSAKHDAA